MPTLAVNVDHVATIRQARGTHYPDPVQAALLAQEAGADAIIMHLREDRRHIQDHDVERLVKAISIPFHFEMAATEEMRDIALRVRPKLVCLVPEKREELTTEGGLAVVGRETFFKDYIRPLTEAGIEISLFIEADSGQIDAAKALGAHYIELHTGRFADAPKGQEQNAEADRIRAGIAYGLSLGLKVNLGHGLTLDNMTAFAKAPGVNEYSIGHALIADAIMLGLGRAVADYKTRLTGFAR